MQKSVKKWGVEKMGCEKRKGCEKIKECEKKKLKKSVSRTPVFSPVLSLCRRVHNHAQCTLFVDSRSSS